MMKEGYSCNLHRIPFFLSQGKTGTEFLLLSHLYEAQVEDFGWKGGADMDNKARIQKAEEKSDGETGLYSGLLSGTGFCGICRPYRWRYHHIPGFPFPCLFGVFPPFAASHIVYSIDHKVDMGMGIWIAPSRIIFL